MAHLSGVNVYVRRQRSIRDGTTYMLDDCIALQPMGSDMLPDRLRQVEELMEQTCAS